MNKNTKINISGIILAAGFSSRMKTNKALLKINPIREKHSNGASGVNGRTFLEEIYSKMKVCVTEVIVVLGHKKEEILSGVELSGAKIVFN